MKRTYQLRERNITIPGDVLLTALVLSFTLPIFRSGGRTNLNFWQWIFNHTTLGPIVEYVPEEDYTEEFANSLNR